MAASTRVKGRIGCHRMRETWEEVGRGPIHCQVGTFTDSESQGSITVLVVDSLYRTAVYASRIVRWCGRSGVAGPLSRLGRH